MTLNEREKELELFNAFVKKELPELFEKHSSGNYFAKVTYDSMFGAWLGAKAQEVSEQLINEIQSWIAVHSTQAMELDGEEFVVGANELAEFIEQLVKSESGADK